MSLTPAHPTSFQRQPAVWIGIFVSCIFAVLQVLLGEGVVDTASADTVTNVVNSVASLLVTFLPLITALLIKPTVTPVAAPKLPVGTPVLIDPPSGAPPDLPPPDAVVAVRYPPSTRAATPAPFPDSGTL